MAALFLLYVVAEVAAVWAVGSAVGVLGTLGLLLAGALLGSWLARREGARAGRAFMAAARAGRSPQAEVTDGMLVGLGGLLILVPGFLSGPRRAAAAPAAVPRCTAPRVVASRREADDRERSRDRGRQRGRAGRPRASGHRGALGMSK
ncbi:hypothetical protein GCM10017788_16580 [Amycolatopsis acidiphila]|nr:hypothetical protein GCM10017788_16580 [Amycolatopsis acidiphila]